MLKPWKNLFKKHILERGQDYFQSGAVFGLEKTEMGYAATVEGSYKYEVEIEIYDEEVVEMFCDCPYAEGGDYCKHMAAVLYEIEDTEKCMVEGELEKIQSETRKLSELETIIKRIPEEEAKYLLLKIALGNKAIQNQILSQYSSEISVAQIKQLKKEIDEIGWRYSDRGGYIDYYHAMDYTYELIRFLHDNVWNLIEKNHLAEAFELTNAVFSNVAEQEMDDSDGGTTEVVYECYEYWKRILKKCNEKEKKQMFQWFMAHRNDYSLDFMQDYMTDFIMEEFHEPELLKQKLQLIDAEIAKAGDDTNCGDWYSVHYGFENNIVKRIQIMRELKCSEEEVDEYKKKYWQFSMIRRLEVNDNVVKGEYERAIEILQESKELDKKYLGLVSDYSSQLVELYKKIGKINECKEELQYLIFSHLQYNLSNIQVMKELCNEEEWIEMREKLLVSKTIHVVKYQLLESEEMYERLLTEIMKEGSVYTLDQYEKQLKKLFPEKVRDMYVKYVCNHAKQVSDRKAYKGLMIYMKKIARYPDGNGITEQIAKEWREEYRRRPAMMDELTKAGF